MTSSMSAVSLAASTRSRSLPTSRTMTRVVSLPIELPRIIDRPSLVKSIAKIVSSGPTLTSGRHSSSKPRRARIFVPPSGRVVVTPRIARLSSASHAAPTSNSP